MKAAFAIAVLLLSAGGCQDEPKTSATPTAPAAITPPQPSARRVGTVCLSYGRDRELVRAQLKGAPGDEALQSKLKSLDELILDVC